MRRPLRREPDWTGQAVTVMGLGLFGGGLGAAAFALRKGAAVTVTDQRDARTLAESVEALRALPGAERLRLVLGEHRAEDFRDADIVIVNPAVRPAAPFIGVARESGARVTTATELLLGGLTCRVAAVTGTHGKSSTVHFAAQLLRVALGPGTRVAVGGNIGGSLLGELESFGPKDIVLLELSSYQLEHLSEEFIAAAARTRALDVAAITTLGVDHLARHGTVENYHAVKRRISELTGPLGHDPGTIIMPGRGASGNRLTATLTLGVPGTFQRENLAVALTIGAALGASEGAMERAIPELTGLPHRMERLGDMLALPDGRPLTVHDNGVSTTPESTVSGLESLGSPAGERVVLVGGQAKSGCDMAALARTAARLDWAIVPFGAAAPEIARLARPAGARIWDPAAPGGGPERDAWPAGAEEAVQITLKRACSSPEVPLTPLHVLFSPACASFDRYPNFSARASAFRRAMTAHGVRAKVTPAGEAVRATERSQSKD